MSQTKKYWFISDLHLFHQNIIEYSNRPFQSVEEMNAAIIKNWNAKVGKNDVIWVLGDIAFFTAAREEKLKAIFAQLNGHKRLIMGNHDTRKIQKYVDVLGFEMVSPYPVIWHDEYLLSHKPTPVKGLINFYGHVHECEQFPTYTVDSACVCVERHNYAPVALEELREKMGECGKKRLFDVINNLDRTKIHYE